MYDIETKVNHNDDGRVTCRWNYRGVTSGCVRGGALYAIADSALTFGSWALYDFFSKYVLPASQASFLPGAPSAVECQGVIPWQKLEGKIVGVGVENCSNTQQHWFGEAAIWLLAVPSAAAILARCIGGRNAVWGVKATEGMGYGVVGVIVTIGSAVGAGCCLVLECPDGAQEVPLVWQRVALLY